MVLMHKLCGGRVPAFHADIDDAVDAALRQRIVESKAHIEQCIEQFRFREGLFAVIDLAREGNKYLQEKEPWKHTDNQTKVDHCLHHALQLCANLAILCNPFLPFTAQKLCHQLKVVDRMLDWENAGRMDLLKPNYPLREPALLFRKVEDAEIEAQKIKLESNAAVAQAPASASAEASTNPLPELKPIIAFEDFDKIDLRSGTITEATRVPKADKLLQLTVDMGFETRTILSGIAAYFSPEDIIGKQVTVVANLAPRKMRGIESNGMILMGENEEGKLVFINPDGLARNGQSVR
jgi:methionyl-tRNA synthetase